MYKKLFALFLMFSLLTSCISVSSDVETATPVQADFVTATLAPTRAGFVPATLTPIPENTVMPTLDGTAPASCKDSAILLRDVTFPDNTQMKAGEKFTKTWEFQNNGTCPWVNYTVKFASGDQMNAPLSAPIPDTAPKDKVLVSVELTAPSTNGTYTGNFTLNDASEKAIPIGIEKTFWVKIIVGDGTAQASGAGNSANTPYVPAGGNSNCSYSQNGGYVQEIISLINQARAGVKLPALTINPQLMSAAQTHSADMACNNFLGHTGSDGSWIGDRIRASGYNTYSYAEIIAIGTPQNAIDQWAADAPHWEFVLNPNGTEFGVGYAYYANSDFGGYITVDFAGQ
ncbi:MAG TPA: NBR1-Ig-like domain-containing protein [Anaerolineales bacterium]|nr:NBR1-Ig-like domain-containing protein [Anaerolineales bacterium]